MQIIVSGTFDILHLGHISMFKTAVDELNRHIPDNKGLDENGLIPRVLVCITSEEYCKKYKPHVKKSTDSRAWSIKRLKDLIFPDHEFEYFEIKDKFDINKYEGDTRPFAPTAIVANNENINNVVELNERRIENGVKPLLILYAERIKAFDGKYISSTRIRYNEIDPFGNNIEFERFESHT